MALTYSEFTTTGASLLADIRTAVLASSDWSQPNAGANANLLKATTTRGAQMVVDFNDSAPNTSRLQIAHYRTHDGTTGVDKTVRHLRTRVQGTFSTNTYRCIVSAGKEHLFVSIEGPRAGENGADNSIYGSHRVWTMMSDVVPYYGAPDDIAPCVAFGGGRLSDSAASLVQGSNSVWVSRSRANTDAWLPARLPTLDLSAQTGPVYSFQRTTKTGDVILSPYVVVEDQDGFRGRLSSFLFAGWNWTEDTSVGVLTANSKVTYNGVKYKLLAVDKTSAQNEQSYGPFGAVANHQGSIQFRSPLVAVPCT